VSRIAVYHAPQTRSTGVMVLVEELGAEVDVVVLDLKAGEHRAPAFLGVNPLGKVPALLDGDALVTEQVAIYLFLADRFPERGLAPAIADPLRGPYLRWMAFYGSSFEPACVDRALKREPGMRGMSPYGDYDSTLKAVTDQLARGPWMLGDRFSALDVLWGTALGWMTTFGIVERDPVVGAYVDRVAARPASRKVRDGDAALAAAQEAGRASSGEGGAAAAPPHQLPRNSSGT
jgi:glutathione S-transferase